MPIISILGANKTDLWDYYMDLAQAGIDPNEVEWEEPSPAVIESLKQDIAMSFAKLFAEEEEK